MATHWGAMKGGAENQAHLLADHLSKTTSHHIFYLGRWVPDDVEPYSYEIVRYNAPKFFSSLRWGQVLDSFSIYRSLDRIQPDVIIQLAAGSITAVCAGYAIRKRIPFWWYIASDNDLGVRAPIGTRSPIGIVDRFLFKHGIRRASHIIAQSSWQADTLVLRYQRKASAIIRNFHPAPASESRTRTPPIVIWVASVKPLKRPELFVDLANRMHKKTDVMFVMVGRCDSVTLGKQLYEANRSLENFSYLGEKSQEEVNDLIGQAYLLVNTSEYEGFPNTFVQAWLRGVPVLSIGIDPDSLVSGESIGMVCEDMDELVANTTRLITDVDARNRLGANAKNYAFANHSMENATKIGELLEASANKFGQN